MNHSLLFFEDDQAAHLDPLTLTRPTYDLRLGLTTIREKWERALHLAHGMGPLRPHLRGVFRAATKKQRSAAAVWINARYLPTPELVATIRRRSEGHLRDGDDLVAAWSTPQQTGAWFDEGRPRPVGAGRAVDPKGLQRLAHPWDIAGLNPAAVEADAAASTWKPGTGPRWSPSAVVDRPERLFMHPPPWLSPARSWSATKGRCCSMPARG